MPGTIEELESDGLRLEAHFARPAGSGPLPALLLLPGFPRGTAGAALVGRTYPPLVDRVARECGWAAMTVQLRGTGTSGGDFSIDGWLADVRAAVDALAARPDVRGIWVAGFRLGGTLAIVTAAQDPRVQGIATFAAPESLESWVETPAKFLEYCRRVGVVRSETFPPDVVAWGRSIVKLDVAAAAKEVGTRPWLLVHGDRDDVVPVEHAHRLAVAAPHAELRIVEHGGHRLRHDPRALAMLLGWLDRQL